VKRNASALTGGVQQLEGKSIVVRKIHTAERHHHRSVEHPVVEADLELASKTGIPADPA
jgi:hypothetical protein